MLTVINHLARGERTAGDDGGVIVSRALDRHAQRRRQGIPTLSVLFTEGDGKNNGEVAWHGWVSGARSGLRAVSVPWPRTAEDFRALEGGVAPLWTPHAATTPAGGDDDGLAVAVDLLAGRLERGVPPGAWVCGLLVPAPGAAAYLAHASESRAKAYFREGLIFPPSAPGATDAAVGPRPARAAAQRALAGIGGDPQAFAAEVGAAADAFDAAQEAAGDAAEGTPDDDRARSAAERFLFTILDALPDTAGQFALNATLPGEVRFGPRPAEVDLLAAGPRVAVEIDGYHHFTDADRYRRDRRKDALLQAHGFLVLRFLADDVVPRLEDVLDTIRTAVVRRLTQP